MAQPLPINHRRPQLRFGDPQLTVRNLLLKKDKNEVVVELVHLNERNESWPRTKTCGSLYVNFQRKAFFDWWF